jgi:hypothetical protein
VEALAGEITSSVGFVRVDGSVDSFFMAFDVIFLVTSFSARCTQLSLQRESKRLPRDVRNQKPIKVRNFVSSSSPPKPRVIA